jgi:lysozyme
LASPRSPLPLAVDVELGGNCASPPPPPTIVRELRAFLLEVEARTGRRPIVYATGDAWDALLRDSALPHRLWIRDLVGEPRLPAGARWTFWQFANRERIPGIDGFVDVDVFNGDRTELYNL